MSKGPKRLYEVELTISHRVEVEARSPEEAENLGVERLKKAVGAETFDENFEVEDVAVGDLEDVTDEYGDGDGEDSSLDTDEDLAASGVRVLTEALDEDDLQAAVLTKMAGQLN